MEIDTLRRIARRRRFFSRLHIHIVFAIAGIFIGAGLALFC